MAAISHIGRFVACPRPACEEETSRALGPVGSNGGYDPLQTVRARGGTVIRETSPAVSAGTAVRRAR